MSRCSVVVVGGVVGLGLALALSSLGGSAEAAARRTARTTQPAAPPATRVRGVNPLTARPHMRAVNTRVRELTKDVNEGIEEPNGDLSFGAAGAELIAVAGIGETELRAVEYDPATHKNQSQRIVVTGVKDGIYRGHLVGTVSTHDLASLPWPAYRKQVAGRIAADRIEVSYDHGPNTARTVIAKGVRSKAATALPIEVPLKKGGMTRVIYDRTDARGNVVGDAEAYGGRIVELMWKGN